MVAWLILLVRWFLVSEEYVFEVVVKRKISNYYEKIDFHKVSGSDLLFLLQKKYGCKIPLEKKLVVINTRLEQLFTGDSLK